MDAVTTTAIIGTFLVAGAVKGVIGLGLPTVSLALLSVLIDLPGAMVLLLVPSFVTNVWQAAVGGHAKMILCRLWSFMLIALIAVWVGSVALVRVDHVILTMLLGLLLVIYSTISLLGVRITVATRWEGPMGLLCGAVNGLLTGMTGSFVVPGVIYLQSIGLARDALIQAMGMLFTVSTIGLAFVLQRHAFLTIELGVVSAIALAPAIIGMIVGQWIRRYLSEAAFRPVFFVALLILGSYIIVRAI